jgi:hypothetical protein
MGLPKLTNLGSYREKFVVAGERNNQGIGSVQIIYAADPDLL